MSPPRPIELVTTQPTSAHSTDATAQPLAPSTAWPPAWLWLAALSVALLAVPFALHARARASARLDPDERAFRAMARRLGLGPRHRRLLRAIAQHHGQSLRPVALLASPSLLRRAATEFKRSGQPLPTGVRPTEFVRLFSAP